MPKSRNRKNHKKKVAARKVRLEAQQKQMMKKMTELQEKYKEEKANEANDSGEVPFTFEGKE